MATSVRSLEPQQERSRESLRRLLRAAAEVMDRYGLAGATIPRIAKQARLTPGAVYRRFKNKEALLETMIVGLLEDQDTALRQFTTTQMTAEIGFDVLAEQFIHGMIDSYRSKAGLLRAVRQFAQDRKNTPFWKKVTKIEVRTMTYAVDLLVNSGEEITHPDPRAAIGLAVVMTVGALWELVVNPPDRQLWQGLIPADDLALKRELRRSFLAYLGVER